MNATERHLNASVLTDEQLERIAFAVIGKINKHTVEGSERPLTRARAAEYIGLSEDSIDRLRRKKVIKAHYLPGISTPFYFASEIHAVLKKN